MTADRGQREQAVVPRVPRQVTAVVLTHMRPGLAGDVVRSLVRLEGLPPSRVVVVVNGDGGLDDHELESQVRTVRLSRNTGPAGGFRAGLVEAFSDPTTEWAYLCEDDVGLFDLPVPRVADVVDRVGGLGASRSVGAVVAYGRTFVGRGAHTVNVVPPPGAPGEFAPVDVACWGATLVSRSVVDAGVLPDPEWFFGLEDFDFFCRVREAGFEVLVDAVAAHRVAGDQTMEGRDQALEVRRPTDQEEAWRSYYHSRNSFALARRHGRASWIAWHLAYSVRHLQAAGSREQRGAIVHGLWDGAVGRMGEHPRYRRRIGEFSPTDSEPGSPAT
ncbi:MAG TPA: glycosyltransferase [Acidimicrobiales bacterium]|nr:glycosyltransferase [Acidimicrobiales bacterium]